MFVSQNTQQVCYTATLLASLPSSKRLENRSYAAGGHCDGVSEAPPLDLGPSSASLCQWARRWYGRTTTERTNVSSATFWSISGASRPRRGYIYTPPYIPLRGAAVMRISIPGTRRACTTHFAWLYDDGGGGQTDAHLSVTFRQARRATCHRPVWRPTTLLPGNARPH